jgi:hypothetical protein
VNIPNTLTLVRIILVPLIVWLIITHEMAAAFLLFLPDRRQGPASQNLCDARPCHCRGSSEATSGTRAQMGR